MFKERKVKAKRALIFLLMVVMLSAAAFTFIGCNFGVKEGDIIKLEAEKAVIEGTPSGSGKLFTTSANSKSENVTSNFKYVSNLAKTGNTILWVFKAEEDGVTDMYLALSNATKDAGEFAVGAGKVFSLNINEEAIEVSENKIKAATEYCDNWQKITLSKINVKAGYNKVVLKILDTTGAINVDYLALNKVKAKVSEHNHNLVNEIFPATCENDGVINRKCLDCGVKYVFDKIAAIGHNYGNYHYNSESKNMVKECRNCADKQFADAPNSKYFGEVFEEKDEYSVKPIETVFEAEHALIDYTVGGLNNGTSPIENYNNASNGKLVANISNLGNFIDFKIESSKVCKVDLSLVLSNVLWTENGIGILDPMSQYVSITINDEQIDFTFVSFPGDANYNYYNWRYVVMKDIDMKEGVNSIKLTPLKYADGEKEGDKPKVTMPNTDALYIYSDEAGVITTQRSYDINNAIISDTFVSEKTNENILTKLESESSFKLVSSVNTMGDLVINLSSAIAIADLRNYLELSVNGKSVSLVNLAIASGSENKLIIQDVKIKIGTNKVKFTKAGSVLVVGMTAYSSEALGMMFSAEIDATYDNMLNADAKIPKLIFEAEDARLTGSTNTGDADPRTDADTASGKKNIERFSKENNVIAWDINLSAAANVDIAIRVSCSNWDGSGNSNMNDLSTFMIIKIDGKAANLSDLNLTCADGGDWYNWTTIVMKGIDLTLGKHTIEIICLKTLPNTDVLYVYSESEATIEKFVEPTPPVEPPVA